MDKDEVLEQLADAQELFTQTVDRQEVLIIDYLTD